MIEEGPDHFLIPNEDPDWITKSRIQSLRFCKRQHLYFAIIQVPFATSPVMIRGRKFHYASSQFYRLVDVTVKPSIKYYRSILPNDPNVNDLYDNFAKFETGRMEQILKEGLDPAIYFLPIINEATVRLPEQECSGHIDRAWLMREEKKVNAVVMEVKTGGISSKTSLRREGCFYVYLIGESELKDYIGCVPEYIGAYSPKENEYWYEKISKRSMNALFETLDELTYLQLRWKECAVINDKLVNNQPLTEEETKVLDEIWPKNPFADCTMCPYERLCWL